jgi:hypothetical protein
MKRPPGTLSLSDITPRLEALFCQAFGQNETSKNGRPPAQEWIGALDEMRGNLKKCSSNLAHDFLSSARQCPWCELEAVSGTVFFLSSNTASILSSTRIDTKTLWAQVDEISAPGPAVLPQFNISIAQSVQKPRVPASPVLREFVPPLEPPIILPRRPDLPTVPPKPLWILRLSRYIMPALGLASLVPVELVAPLQVAQYPYEAGAGSLLFVSAMAVFGQVLAKMGTAEARLRRQVRRTDQAADKAARLVARNAKREYERQVKLARAKHDEELQAGRQRYEVERRAAASKLHELQHDAAARRDAARKALNELTARWSKETDDAPYQSVLLELQAKRQEIMAWDSKREALLRALEGRKRQQQLQAHLQKFRIEPAQISGLGPGRKAKLLSFGIETAADCDRGRIMMIQGFGPSTTDKIIAWRQRCEGSFRFNPALAVDPREVQAIEREIRSQQAPIASAIMAGVGRLRGAQTAIMKHREALAGSIAKTKTDLAQAEADMQVLA